MSDSERIIQEAAEFIMQAENWADDEEGEAKAFAMKCVREGLRIAAERAETLTNNMERHGHCDLCELTRLAAELRKLADPIDKTAGAPEQG